MKEYTTAMAPASTRVPNPPKRPTTTITGRASSHFATQIAWRASAQENRERSAPHFTPW